MSGGDETMRQTTVTAFICVTCRGRPREPQHGETQRGETPHGDTEPGDTEQADTDRPGRMLFEAVTDALRGRAEAGVAVKPVECLSVCKRPATVALAAPGKWTYVVGDLDHRVHADDVIAMAERYAATADGIVPWRERPQSFRKGVVARIPPPDFTSHITDPA